MSARLTDEGMAKVLGWEKHVYVRTGKLCMYTTNTGVSLHKIPPFTTSLDAITAEIEARGLKWEHDGPYFDIAGEEVIHTAIVRKAGDLEQHAFRDKTAPLALCAALRDYLKKS